MRNLCLVIMKWHWNYYYITDSLPSESISVSQISLCHILDSTCKQYPMVFVSFRLTLLSVISSRSIHVAANGNIFFFMAEQYSIVYMYIFFIHSSVHRHLGHFHVLAIVNSAAMNIGVHVSFQIIYIFAWIYAQDWDFRII